MILEYWFSEKTWEDKLAIYSTCMVRTLRICQSVSAWIRPLTVIGSADAAYTSR